MVDLDNLISISEAAKTLNVSEKTLREWDSNGKFVAEKTEGGHRRYKMKDVLSFYDKCFKLKEDDNYTQDLIRQDFEHQKANRRYEIERIQKNYPDNIDYRLMLLLENTRLVLRARTDTTGECSDFIESLVSNFWNKLKSKLFEDINVMLNPSEMIFVNCNENSKEFYKCESLMAENVFLDFQNLSKISHRILRKLTTLSTENDIRKEVTEETISGSEFCQYLTDEEIIDFNSTSMANEVDREIIQLITNNSKVLHAGIKFLTGESPTYILTNNVGLHILKKLPEYNDTFFRDKIHVSDHVGNYFIVNKNPTNRFFYRIYIPYTPAPKTTERNRIIFRRGVYISPQFKNNCFKIAI